MFLQVCVCPRGEGVSQHALQVSRPTPMWEVEGDLAIRGLQHALQQVSKGEVKGNPRPCLAGFQAHTQVGSWGESGQGGLQAHTQRGTCSGGGACSRGGPVPGGGLLQGCLLQCGNPPWQLLLQAVHILLECILVNERGRRVFEG